MKDENYLRRAPSSPRSYRYREPLSLFGESFVRTVFDAFSHQQLSLARASHYLDGLKIKDFYKLNEYVLSS